MLLELIPVAEVHSLGAHLGFPWVPPSLIGLILAAEVRLVLLFVEPSLTELVLAAAAHSVFPRVELKLLELILTAEVHSALLLWRSQGSSAADVPCAELEPQLEAALAELLGPLEPRCAGALPLALLVEDSRA